MLLALPKDIEGQDSWYDRNEAQEAALLPRDEYGSLPMIREARDASSAKTAGHDSSARTKENERTHTQT